MGNHKYFHRSVLNVDVLVKLSPSVMMKTVVDRWYTNNKNYFQFIHIYEAYCFEGCDTVRFGESPTLRRNISTQSSGWRSKPSKKPAEVGGEVLLVSFLSCEATCFSETSGYPRIARRNNPSDSNLQSLPRQRRTQQASLFQCTLPRFYWVQLRRGLWSLNLSK
jgi:hypothetical protein